MNVKYYVRALLCLYLTILLPICNIHAQALKVGDTLPEELWSMPLQVVNHPERKESITLSEYKDKLIILDFWATWCGPCIKSLNKLDSLQRQFAKQLAVVPITAEANEIVLPFIKKRKWGLASVVKNTTLTKNFPHLGIPHQVWIKDSQVLAITGAGYTTALNIESILLGKNVKMLTKDDDTDFVPEDYLVANGDEWCVSGIKKRVNAHIGGMRISKNGLVYYNTTAEYMFRDLLRKKYPFLSSQNRVIYDTPDSLTYQLKHPLIPESGIFAEDSSYQNWLQNNTYVYYVRFSEPQPRNRLYRKMQEDITTYFEVSKNIEVSVEKRTLLCYVLRRTNIIAVPTAKNNPAYTLDNKPFRYFYEDLLVHTDKQPYPIIDETGFSGNYTLKLSSSPEDITALQRELPAFGIELVLTTREIEMMVFKQKTN